MDNPMLAWLVIGLGVVLVLISLFADPLGLGRHPGGFGWKQDLALIIGAAVIMVGVYLLRRGKGKKLARGIWQADSFHAQDTTP
jgi:hypothetical protein